MASEEAGQTEEKIQTAIENAATSAESVQKDQMQHHSIYDSMHDVIDPNNPKIWSISQKQEQEADKRCFNPDVRVRLMRWCFIAMLPIIFLTIETHVPEVDITVLLAIAIELLYIIYFSIIAYFFYSGSRQSKNRTLFRVWTKAEKVTGWAPMTVATHQQLYPFEAIQSISEFSAVDGGVPSFMLSNLGTFTWTIVAMHYATELECDSQVFTWDIVDVLEVMGVLGLVMIGIFELDPYNPPMQRFHYLGAITGCGTIAGFLLQQISLTEKFGYKLIWLPILIAVIAISCFILWQYSNKQTNEYQRQIQEKYKGKTCDQIDSKELAEIRAKITSFSLKNVTREGTFLFMGATSLALWMGFYHQDCKIGCAGPQS